MVNDALQGLTRKWNCLIQEAGHLGYFPQCALKHLLLEFQLKFGMFYEKKRLKQEGCFIYRGGDNPVMRHCVPWEQYRVG